MDLELKYWNTHNITITNTINGKPVQYLKNATGGIIPPGAGQVILANCSNVTVKDQNLSNVSTGLIIVFSKFISIQNNTCNSNNYNGISLQFSFHNTLINNILLPRLICNHFNRTVIYMRARSFLPQNIHRVIHNFCG